VNLLGVLRPEDRPVPTRSRQEARQGICTFKCLSTIRLAQKDLRTPWHNGVNQYSISTLVPAFQLEQLETKVYIVFFCGRNLEILHCRFFPSTIHKVFFWAVFRYFPDSIPPICLHGLTANSSINTDVSVDFWPTIIFFSFLTTRRHRKLGSRATDAYRMVLTVNFPCLISKGHSAMFTSDARVCPLRTETTVKFQDRV
jgi:hypothetical protein